MDGYYSESCLVTSGVPQGSVLGPQFFTVLIEVLLKCLARIKDVNVFAYADDIKLASSNPARLQKSLDSVGTWTNQWQLRINPTKSEYIRISSSTSTSSLSTTSPPIPTYFIDNSLIALTDSVRDLGVTIQSDLKFSSHISKIYSKSIALVYILLRSFNTKNPRFYVNLYKLYTRPILEYNSTTWNPYLISDVLKLESVQRTFTRKLFKKLNLSYNDYGHRLQILGLETLEARRVKLDLILTYKILNNLVDIKSSDFFKINPVMNSYSLRRHKFYLQKPFTPNSAIPANFFTYRVLNTWNKLPSFIVNSENLSTFKLRLNQIDINEFYQPKSKLT